MFRSYQSCLILFLMLHGSVKVLAARHVYIAENFLLRISFMALKFYTPDQNWFLAFFKCALSVKPEAKTVESFRIKSCVIEVSEV